MPIQQKFKKVRHKRYINLCSKSNIVWPLLLIFIIVGTLFYFRTINKKINYADEEYGFSLSYPKRLGLSFKIRNIDSDYKEYLKMCEEAKGAGCGGGPWPKYEVDFANKKGQKVFYVRVYDAREFSGVLLREENIKFGGITPAGKEIAHGGVLYETVFNGLTYTFTGTSKTVTLVGGEVIKKEEDYGVDLKTLEKIGDSFRLSKK